jgi:hypothetical protein
VHVHVHEHLLWQMAVFNLVLLEALAVFDLVFSKPFLILRLI